MKRPFNILNRGIKACLCCGNNYVKNKKYSLSQWNNKKYCSPKCAGEAKKIKDGMDRAERYRRKSGSVKQGTDEFKNKISKTTKQAMYRSDVQDKIRKPKGKMSQDAKIIRSNALVGKMPKNLSYNNSHSNIQRGTYICSKGDFYFRSKWEANYALYLDFLVQNHDIVNWEYEADRFMFEKIQLGTRSYTPDFKVFGQNGDIEYHEVKGYMDSRSKTKLKRMKKYYPEVKLLLIERKQYMEILKKLGGLIKFY